MEEQLLHEKKKRKRQSEEDDRNPAENNEITKQNKKPTIKQSQKSSENLLADTQYASLEEKVKSMIQKQLRSEKPKRKDKHVKQKQDITQKPKELPTEREEPVSSEAQEYVNRRTVYIQGLPFSCEEPDVRAFFEDQGCTIKSLRLARWHDSGKLKGYGHVEFEDEESSEKAIELSGQYIQNRYITIERPLVPRSLAGKTEQTEKIPGCRTIFVRNLPYDVTESEIREQFMVFGPIVSVRLAVWNHTNNLKGFGYIEFKREDSAEIAVKKSGSIRLKGRIISADFETSGPKKGYKGLNDPAKSSKSKS